MDEKKTGRIRIVYLGVSTDQFEVLEKRWKKSTIRQRSEYLRRVLFGKAVTTYTRNQSLDEFMAEMALLRKELNAMGMNFNQAVHHLHTLDHLPQMQLWLRGFERDRNRYFETANAIKQKINSIAIQWLR